MEAKRIFEGTERKETIEDDFTAYERLLNQMYNASSNLSMKTEYYNPLEVSRFNLITTAIEQEGKRTIIGKDEKGNPIGLLDEEAELLRAFGHNYAENMVSDHRKGRTEGFDAIKSYNLGNLSMNDEESEKFKRILKDMK
jgi:hypothetical protein